MATSDYLEQRILEHILNASTNLTLPAIPSVYVALFETDPTDAGTGTERATTLGYARKQVTAGFTNMTGVLTGISANTSEIAFAQASGDWTNPITHIALFDAVTGGNMLYHGILQTAKTIDNLDTFKIAIGDLAVTLG